MKKYILILVLSIAGFANEINFENMKNCESVKLSNLSSLVSCHQVDYLVEYRIIDDEEKDSVKKITVITPTKQVVIKNIGK